MDEVDPVREVFCHGPAPAIASLEDLRAALVEGAAPGTRGSFAYPLLLGHSTALSGRVVSSINPRAITLYLARGITLAFQRGIQQVELSSRAPQSSRQTFYLVRFTQACNHSQRGCTPGDLYTPRIESDWNSLELLEDVELENTTSDCKQCHQRAREAPILLMRESEPPWTHFFDPRIDPAERPQSPGVLPNDLTQDYLDARGTEPYAGIDLAALPANGGAILQRMAATPQPLTFLSETIANERWPLGPDGYPSQPLRSPTWDAAYDAFKRGEQLALPYFEQRASDPEKLARATHAYAAYREGRLDAAELPDLSDVFPDDPATRAQIGLQTEPAATPVSALIQACGACHNDVLDQSLTRARFNIDLSRMDERAIQRAIERIELPSTDPKVMPPNDARQLDAEGRERLLSYLRATARRAPVPPEPQLERAAQLGMTGGAAEF